MKRKDLYSQVVKFKKLHRMSTVGFGVLIPKRWVEEMNWVRNTPIKLVFNADKGEILISKIQDGEKISNIDTE